VKVYFPQWQGSGTGIEIATGAKAILDYLQDPDFVSVQLALIEAGTHGKQKHNINNYDALSEQLLRLKQTITQKNPDSIRTIGGDCGLEIVPVSYLNKKFPNLGVIWFDAHADINRPCDSGSCNFHGMPLRTLLGEGERAMDNLLSSYITAAQIHYVGLRDIDEAEKERIEKDAIYAPRVLNTEELVHTLKKKGIQQLYLHFDFDCLEPQDYDKTYYQIPDGVRIKDAEACIKVLQKEFHIVGSSVLESVTQDQKALQPITSIIKLLM